MAEPTPDRHDEARTSLPHSYVDHMETNGAWEGFLAGSDEYIVLRDRQAIRGHYEDYEMAGFLDPRWFPFGSNGGEEMLCFDIQSRDDAVYRLPFVGMSDEEPIL